MGGQSNATERAIALLERNAAVVRMKLNGWTWPEMAAELKVTETTCRTAWREYQEIGMAELEGENPQETAWELLENYRRTRLKFMTVYDDAKGNHTARIGALKGFLDALSKETELRQHLRLLPRDLGQIAVAIDMRYVQTALLAVLNKYGDALPDTAIDEMIDALAGSVQTAREKAAAALDDED